MTISNEIDFTTLPGGGILCGNGMLQTNLVFAEDACLMPGDHSMTHENAIGLFTINGSFIQSDGSLNMELGGTAAGEYDNLIITGMADLSGELIIELLDDYTPECGDSFDILDWGSITAGSSFDTIYLPELDDDLQWSTSRLYTDGTISVVPEPASMTILLLGLAGLIRPRRSGRAMN